MSETMNAKRKPSVQQLAHRATYSCGIHDIQTKNQRLINDWFRYGFLKGYRAAQRRAKKTK